MIMVSKCLASPPKGTGEKMVETVSSPTSVLPTMHKSGFVHCQTMNSEKCTDLTSPFSKIATGNGECGIMLCRILSNSLIIKSILRVENTFVNTLIVNLECDYSSNLHHPEEKDHQIQQT